MQAGSELHCELSRARWIKVTSDREREGREFKAISFHRKGRVRRLGKSRKRPDQVERQPQGCSCTSCHQSPKSEAMDLAPEGHEHGEHKDACDSP